MGHLHNHSLTQEVRPEIYMPFEHRLVYRMLKYGQEYVDKGTQLYAQKLREQQLQLLKKKAATLGLRIVEAEDVA